MNPSLLHPFRVLGFLLTAALMTAAHTSLAADTRCFELRIYTASPGKLDDLHARFRNHTMRLFERHGMTNIGYWVPIENPETKLYYVLAYPNGEAREQSWKEFQADPEWQKAKGESEAQGKLVSNVESTLMAAEDFSPLIKSGEASARRIFELRNYVASAGNFDRMVARAREHTDSLLHRFGMTHLATWTPLEGQPGAGSLLTYLLAHPSVTAAEASYKKMRDDPEWMAIKEASEKDAGGALTLPGKGIVSVYLTPTDYSPLK